MGVKAKRNLLLLTGSQSDILQPDYYTDGPSSAPVVSMVVALGPRRALSGSNTCCDRGIKTSLVHGRSFLYSVMQLEGDLVMD